MTRRSYPAPSTSILRPAWTCALLAAVALLGCGPGQDSSSQGGSAGSSTGGTGGTGGVDIGDPPVACSPNVSVTGDTFDPNQVYLVGSVSEGSCDANAIAHYSSPNTAGMGFPCYFDDQVVQIRPTDGRLLYGDSDTLREFRCDACPVTPGNYPDPIAIVSNDPVHDISPCSQQGLLVGLLTSPDGAVLHRCNVDPNWYDESGTAVFQEDSDDALLHLGYGNLALTQTLVVNLQNGHKAQISGLPDGTILAIRAEQPDRFFLVLASIDASGDATTELWMLDHTGQAVLAGQYPPLPDNTHVQGWSALEGCRALIQEVSTPDLTDAIVRRQIGGTTETVYTEADDPLVHVFVSPLVTGP